MENTNDNPNQIGQLTPDEQSHLLGVRQESQRHLAKIGEYEVLKNRLLTRINELDRSGQDAINAISKRLGVEDGQQWVALQDGTIQLVKTGDPEQAETTETETEEGAEE